MVTATVKAVETNGFRRDLRWEVTIEGVGTTFTVETLQATSVQAERLARSFGAVRLVFVNLNGASYTR